MSNVVRLPNLISASRAVIRGIREHTVTRSARKDPLDPQVVVVNTVSLGYFMHLDFGPESGPMAISCGPTPPDNLQVGQTVIVAIMAEAKVD